MSHSLKSKLTVPQSLQKLLSVALIVLVSSVSTQLSADSNFLEDASKIFTQLEVVKPKIQNDLIDRERSRVREQQPPVKIRFSLDQAVSRARSQSGGRVIKAQTTWRNGRPMHIIRILSDDKRVKTYRYDGVSGRRL